MAGWLGGLQCPEEDELDAEIALWMDDGAAREGNDLFSSEDEEEAHEWPGAGPATGAEEWRDLLLAMAEEADAMATPAGVQHGGSGSASQFTGTPRSSQQVHVCVWECMHVCMCVFGSACMCACTEAQPHPHPQPQLCCCWIDVQGLGACLALNLPVDWLGELALTPCLSRLCYLLAPL